MDNPSLVARLVALNERTRKAWAHPHNKKHYVPASFQGFKACGRASRQPTPADEDMIQDVCKEDTEPELRLYLHNRPRDITKGWVFGSDKRDCDIYCGELDKESKYNIGRQTFSITLNELGQVILKHLRKTNRTQVQYDSQNAGPRQEFVWTMLPFCPNIYVISAKQLKFEVIVLQLEEQTDLCLRFRSQFLMDVWLGKLSRRAPSPVSTQPMEPFYYVCKDRPLGGGSFGNVYIVVDVSTGVEYAGKTFHGEHSRSEADILANQDHVSHTTFFTICCACHIDQDRIQGTGDKPGRSLPAELTVSAGKHPSIHKLIQQRWPSTSHGLSQGVRILLCNLVYFDVI